MFLEFNDQKLMNHEAFYNSPIGTIQIIGNEEGIISLLFMEVAKETSSQIPDCLQDCVAQLDQYFNKTRTSFDLKLQLLGTDFQKTVWQELQNIRFGETTSYLEQSKKMDKTLAIRAIAAANGKNPISIIIPCHRVIGSDGSLTGYAGGLWRKKWLLEHENPTNQTSLF
jgi:methylated-DNA-[protein]-cysteine S-methyltransferase